MCAPSSRGGDALQIEHNGSAYDVTVNLTPSYPCPYPYPYPYPFPHP